MSAFQGHVSFQKPENVPEMVLPFIHCVTLSRTWFYYTHFFFLTLESYFFIFILAVLGLHCHTWALLPHGMWDLSFLSVYPPSLALEDAFLTTGPPGKSTNWIFFLTYTALFIYFIYSWPHCAACEILVPRPGIEPDP